MGDELCLRAIELDAGHYRPMLWERATSRDLANEKCCNALAPGEIRSRKSRSLCGFCAVVDLGVAEGVIHISEFSCGRIDHRSDMPEPGDEVYVMNVQLPPARVSVGMKRLSSDPWASADERF